MSADHLLIDRDPDGVVRLTLNRPETRNSLTFDLYRRLTDFFREERLNEDTRVVLLTGAGKGFCSGGDVHEIIGALRGAGMKRTLDFAWMTGELIQNMRTFDRPIVSAIGGTCVGAGAVIALASDFRVLAEEVSIGFLFSKVGLTGADMGAAYLLPRVVGQAHATEILMLGEPVNAEKALRIGLANEVVPRDQVQEAARGWVDRLLAQPPYATRVTKRMLVNEASMDLATAIESEAQAQALMMMGKDHDEFHAAFAEKRQPKFRGE